MNKVCCKCKRELDIIEFHKNKREKDGLCDSCKRCRSKMAQKRNSKNRTEFKCIDCHEPRSITISYLKEIKEGKSSGRCKKCASRISSSIEYGKAAFNSTFNCYIINAKNRCLSFNLTEEQFKEITSKNCYYCTSEPKNITKPKGNNGNFIYSGIDRKDNSKGYTIDNCVPCCSKCNTAKNDSTYEEYLDWIKRSYNHLFLNSQLEFQENQYN